MNMPTPIGWIKWPLTLLLLCIVLQQAYQIQEGRKKRDNPERGDRVPGSRRDVIPGEITLKAEQARAMLLEVAAVRDEGEWREPVTVYGRVVPNPAATMELRAAFPGTLRPGESWPAPGQAVQAGASLGWLEVRVGPQERLDLENKLNEARRKYAGAVQTRKVWQARLERLQLLPKSLTLKELEEAQVQLGEARTQEAVAEEAIKLWERALDEIGHPSAEKPSAWNQPLHAPAAGEVTELLARPGMVVEAGAVLLRVVDFRQSLVRLDLPAETVDQGPPAAVKLIASVPVPLALRGARNQPQAGAAARTVPATLVGPAPQVDAGSQLAGCFYKVALPAPHEQPSAGGSWRPGLLVQAELPAASPRAPGQPAVSVPATALLYHQGRAVVYVLRPRTDEIKWLSYARREVEVMGRRGDRWILAKNIELLDEGDEVVVKNAQMLLSEEFKQDVDND